MFCCKKVTDRSEIAEVNKARDTEFCQELAVWSPRNVFSRLSLPHVWKRNNST